MLSVVFVLVAQLPIQDTTVVERVTGEVDRKPRFAATADEKSRALTLFDPETFMLLPNAPLSNWDAMFVTSTDRPVDLEAKAIPLFKKSPGGSRECVAAVDLSFRSQASDLNVDWSKASIVVNGVARGAVPGFARKMTSSLAQRPSTAPAGAIINEQVIAVDAPDGECISDGSDLAVDVPIKVGAREDRVRAAIKKEPVAATEAEVFSLLDEPSVRWAAPVDPDPPAPIAAIVGASGCFVACATIWGISAYTSRNSPTLVGVLVGGSVFSLGSAGAGAGAGYLFIDGPASAKWSEDKAVADGRAKDLVRVATWKKRRLELGLKNP